MLEVYGLVYIGKWFMGRSHFEFHAVSFSCLILTVLLKSQFPTRAIYHLQFSFQVSLLTHTSTSSLYRAIFDSSIRYNISKLLIRRYPMICSNIETLILNLFWIVYIQIYIIYILFLTDYQFHSKPQQYTKFWYRSCCCHHTSFVIM